MSGMSDGLRYQEELNDRDYQYGFRYSSDNTFGEHERKAIICDRLGYSEAHPREVGK